MSTFTCTRHLPTCNGKATMDMQANTPPDFTLKTDRDRDLSAEQVVVAYHERTKHHYHRYAAALGYMDWAKQPDPFRRYDGAPLVRLPFPDAGRVDRQDGGSYIAERDHARAGRQERHR